MKKLLTCLFVLGALSAHAFVNEVECDGNVGSSRMDLEVERSFGGMRPARMTVWGERGSNPEIENFVVRNVRSFAGRLEYSGDRGFSLEVDLWPDRAPAWGRTYRANLRTREFTSARLSCRFPNARP
jgi:hypothetical protein